MNPEILVSKIGLNPEAFSSCRELKISASEYERLKLLFHADEEEFFRQAEEIFENPARAYLALFLNFALDCYEEYRLRGISEKIYFDTMQDLRIWSDRCFRETGEWGLKEVYWLKEHLKLKLFKLGRLQFQPKKYQTSIFRKPLFINGVPLAENADICFVHIPEGAPLLDEETCESYRFSKAFFKKDFVYLCESWLLSPVLKEILAPDSNIIRFQSRYEILDFYETETVGKYLYNSSSRVAKALESRKIGTALGYLKDKF